MNNIIVLIAFFARKKIELTFICLKIKIISVFKNALNLFQSFDVRIVPFLDSNIFYNNFNNFYGTRHFIRTFLFNYYHFL